MKKPQRRILFTGNASLAFTKAEAADTIGTLTGYPIVWNVLSTDRGGYKVRLLPGSATFATPTQALFHHDASRVLGNTANQTLKIEPDKIGVKVTINLPNSSDGRDAAALVGDKYITGMSFAMVDAPVGDMVTEGTDKILNAKSFLVDEVSITGTPSFTQTSVELADDQEDEPEFSIRTRQSLKLQQYRFSSLALPR